MNEHQNSTPAENWALLRFAIIGPLLSSPPEHGLLAAEIKNLSKKTWHHPTNGGLVQFGFSTIERWFYKALSQPNDPVGSLRKKVRSDAGKIDFNLHLAKALQNQYKRYKEWSYALHTDNLVSLVEEKPDHGPMPSYSKVVRYMKSCGFKKKKRSKRKYPQSAVETKKEEYEIRSFEAIHVGSLWHLDFHHGSKKVLAPNGQWCTPMVLGILDDRSRVACHVQWYFNETAEDLVHGLCQAFQKWRLPRALMTDNGAAMKAEEFVQGLKRLGITHETTLPYCPYQNAKQESFWGSLEGRLVAMLKHVKTLTLEFLNEATQAWVDQDYNRKFHSEINQTPLERYLADSDVLRECPSSEALREEFRLQTIRTQRQSDGTVSIENVRFEIPSRFRHTKRLTVRYARWNLQSVHLINPREDKILCRIYPLDKEANSDGRRRKIAQKLKDTEPDELSQEELPPYLKKMLNKYKNTGKPPGYISKPFNDSSKSDHEDKNNNNGKEKQNE